MTLLGETFNGNVAPCTYVKKFIFLFENCFGYKNILIKIYDTSTSRLSYNSKEEDKQYALPYVSIGRSHVSLWVSVVTVRSETKLRPVTKTAPTPTPASETSTSTLSFHLLKIFRFQHFIRYSASVEYNITNG